MRDVSVLFSPTKLGSLEVPNRVFMAPMTRSRAQRDGVPGPLAALYYVQRASAGLIINEATQVAPEGQGYVFTPGIYTDAHVAGWRKVTDAVHAAGGRIFLQLWHVGRISHPSLQPGGALPVAPSAIAHDGQTYTYEGMQPFPVPRALETDEIPAVVAQFGHGAAMAKAAGFDGVEIHGANGYLVDQFLRDGTNRRTDRYGGSPENRARFLLEVTEAAAKVWGEDRVGVRLSPFNSFNGMSDSDPRATFGHAVAQLDKLGLAYLHMVEGAAPEQQASLEAIRGRWSGTYIANAAYDGERAAAAIRNGWADAVAFGQPFIANPDLPLRLLAGAPLAAADSATFYGGDERGYTDYAASTELRLAA